MDSFPDLQAATKSRFVWPAAFIAALLAAYSALHWLEVLVSPAEV
jgi:hypothetical protein